MMWWAVFSCVKTDTFEILSLVDACLAYLKKNLIWWILVFSMCCLYLLYVNWHMILSLYYIFQVIITLETHATINFNKLWHVNILWLIKYDNILIILNYHNCWIKLSITRLSCNYVSTEPNSMFLVSI